MARRGSNKRQAYGPIDNPQTSGRLERDQGLIMIETDQGIESALQVPAPGRVGRNRTFHVHALASGQDRSRNENSSLLATKQTLLPCVGIEGTQAQAGLEKA
jgi:hypothetical protein